MTSKVLKEFDDWAKGLGLNTRHNEFDGRYQSPEVQEMLQSYLNELAKCRAIDDWGGRFYLLKGKKE